MAVSARAVTVATTATQLDTNGRPRSRGGQSLSAYNDGAATVYLGGADVTTAAGYPLAAGEHMAFDLNGGDQLFGIVASGTVAVRVLEIGV